jgi:hypothetical protein
MTRRTRSEIEEIEKQIMSVLSEDSPQTVRQVFYRLVSTGAIAKTENEYRHTVSRMLTKMRVQGEIPFGWIADSTRWMRKPRTFDNMMNALESTVRDTGGIFSTASLSTSRCG